MNDGLGPGRLRSALARGITAACLLAVAGCSGTGAGASNDTSAEPVSPPPSAARTTTTTSPASSTTARPTTATESARPFVVSGDIGPHEELIGDAHTVAVVDWHEMKTFTAEGKPLAELEVSDNDMPGVTCGRIVFSDPAGRSQLITLRVGTVPARGVEPARYEVYLTSWNPDDLSQKWETKLTTEPQDGTPAACATDRLDATTDGKWLTVANVGTDFSSFVVAAESGAAQSVDYYPMPLGHFVGSFIGTNPASLSNVDDLRVIDPADNSVVNVMHGRSTDGGTTALDAVVNAASEPNEATWLEDGETVVAYHNFATHIVNVRTGALVHSIEFPEEVNGFSADPLVDPVSNHLLIHYACSGGCSDRLEGYEWGTWRKLWSQSRIDNMCTTHSGQVTVAANDQVAILDAATGNQIQFTTELEDCGDVFGNFGYNEKSGKMYRLTN